MKAAAAHQNMQLRLTGWMLVVLAVSGLSGCSSAPGDEPPADTGTGEPIGDPSGVPQETTDRAADGTWWDDVAVETYAPLNVCVPVVCVVKQEDQPIHIVRSNATMLHFNASVTWEEGSNPSFRDREVTVSCSGEAGCTGLEEPLMFSGPDPVLIHVPDIRLPPNATLVVDVQIPDPTPDPLRVNIDGKNGFRLEGALRLQPDATKAEAG